MDKLKACPFCGKKVEFSTIGTWIEIDCCVTMSRQKSDYLTREERQTWNKEIAMYSRDVEIKVFNWVAKEWNKRS